MSSSRDNLHKRAWRYLNLLRTPKGSEYRLAESGRSLGSPNKRAQALSVLTNAAYEAYEDYLVSRSVVSLYYMSFKLIQGLIVSTSPNINTLGQLQESSKYGHGIRMLLKERSNFPRGVMFWYEKRGMFYDLINSYDWVKTTTPLSNNQIDRLVKNGSKEKYTINNIFNASDLIRRIPELTMYLANPRIGMPLFFRTSQGPNINDPGADIYSDNDEWKAYSRSSIKRLIGKFNRKEAAYNENVNEIYKFSPQFNKVFHYQVFLEIPLYNYWVIRLGEINDMLPIYFALLYIISILARYYPLEWLRITSGPSNIYPMFESFTDLCLNGIPVWVCSRILGKPDHYIAGY